jgi:hypothetical protein
MRLVASGVHSKQGDVIVSSAVRGARFTRSPSLHCASTLAERNSDHHGACAWGETSTCLRTLLRVKSVRVAWRDAVSPEKELDGECLFTTASAGKWTSLLPISQTHFYYVLISLVKRNWILRSISSNRVSYVGAHGSVVVKAAWYKPEGHVFESRWGEWIVSIYLIHLGALGPGVYSASNWNEYQKQKNNVSGEESAAGTLGWQPYHHLWDDNLDNVGSLTSHNLIGLHGLLRG